MTQDEVEEVLPTDLSIASSSKETWRVKMFMPRMAARMPVVI